ncbi:MAG: Rieske 2Fe-2S domain-containing protein [Gemmatimonadaceae bacterium]
MAGDGSAGMTLGGPPNGGAHGARVGVPVDQSRREALRMAWRIGQGLLAAAAGYTTFVALRPLGNTNEGERVILGAPEGFVEGSATYVAAGRFWVTRSKGELFALTQNCPHLGCRLPYCEGSGRFECPCHGSQFNLAGEWISGPSPRGIDRFTVSVDEGRVVVDTRTLTEGPPLGAKEHERPALGASCVNVAS